MYATVEPRNRMSTTWHMCQATFNMLWLEARAGTPAEVGWPENPPEMDEGVHTLFGMRIEQDESLPVGELKLVTT